MVVACGTYGKLRGSCTGSVVMPDGKRPLEIPKCRWEDKLKMKLPGKYWRRVISWLRIETDGGLFST